MPQPSAIEHKTTICASCDIACPLVAEVEDGPVVKVRASGNPLLEDSICMKGANAPRGFSHPDRLPQPLERSGDRAIPEVPARLPDVTHLLRVLESSLLSPDLPLDLVHLDPLVIVGVNHDGVARLDLKFHIAQVGALVMGRRTYYVVAGFAGDRPYGQTPVLVATHRPLEATEPSVPPVSGTVEELVDEARTEAGRKDVYLDGSNLIRQGLDASLVDEMTITVIPIVLGAGRHSSRA